MLNHAPQPQRAPERKPRVRALTPLPMRRYPQRVWLDRAWSLIVMALLASFVVFLLWVLFAGI